MQCRAGGSEGEAPGHSTRISRGRTRPCYHLRRPRSTSHSSAEPRNARKRLLAGSPRHGVSCTALLENHSGHVSGSKSVGCGQAARGHYGVRAADRVQTSMVSLERSRGLRHLAVASDALRARRADPTRLLERGSCGIRGCDRENGCRSVNSQRARRYCVTRSEPQSL